MKTEKNYVESLNSLVTNDNISNSDFIKIPVSKGPQSHDQLFHSLKKVSKEGGNGRYLERHQKAEGKVNDIRENYKVMNYANLKSQLHQQNCIYCKILLPLTYISMCWIRKLAEYI